MGKITICARLRDEITSQLLITDLDEILTFVNSQIAICSDVALLNSKLNTNPKGLLDIELNSVRGIRVITNNGNVFKPKNIRFSLNTWTTEL
jgi:hypothetical protein